MNKKIILTILVATLMTLLLTHILPSELFLPVTIDGGYRVSSYPIRMIVSLLYVNMILIIVFGYLIYTKEK